MIRSCVILGLLCAPAALTQPAVQGSRHGVDVTFRASPSATTLRAEPVIWAGLSAGPHHVGVNRIGSESGVDIVYWYPAGAGGDPARLRDFAADPASLVAMMREAGLPTDAAQAYLDSPLRARWRAPRTDGRLPLVLLAQGNGHTAFDQAVLAEFLASHGFAVATTPSPALRAPMRSEADVPVLAQRQAEELLQASRRLSAIGIADASRLGAIGHSFGARSALLLAMREPAVKALISLDGGIGTSTAAESFTRAAWFSKHAALPPVLHFYETADSFMRPDFSLLRSLPAVLTLRQLDGLRHVHFSTLGFRAAVDEAMGRVTGLGAEGAASIRAMVEELLRMLRTELQ